MDRLLQSHQAETTARRLQLERSLSQKQGELSARTQEVEELTVHRNEDSATIKELREQLAQLKEDNMNMFSGSQAQLLSKASLAIPSHHVCPLTTSLDVHVCPLTTSLDVHVHPLTTGLDVHVCRIQS